jgi:hypothetical protein
MQLFIVLRTKLLPLLYLLVNSEIFYLSAVVGLKTTKELLKHFMSNDLDIAKCLE